MKTKRDTHSSMKRHTLLRARDIPTLRERKKKKALRHTNIERHTQRQAVYRHTPAVAWLI